MSLPAILLVLLGGFLGGIARFHVSGRVGARIGETFPWGTLAVNVSGSFLIGLLFAFGRDLEGAAGLILRDFLVTGFCGGFTTVSSFALQTVALAADGETRPALLNVAGSAALCLAAVALGYWAGAALAAP